MAYSRNLINLANILNIRRQANKPYHLLLTSTISISSGVLQKITGSKSWEKFTKQMLGLAHNDKMALLMQVLDDSSKQDGYQCLANLVQNGYFATILDANIDSQLENAVSKTSYPGNDFQTLIIDRDRDEYIVSALGEYRSSPRIIKLRGSLSNNVLPDNYPNSFEFRHPLRSSLERYVNQDILVVGEIYREGDISRLMNASGGNIFYVVSSPSRSDDIIKTMQIRGLAKGNNIISGEYGDFNSFFTALWNLLGPESASLPAVLVSSTQQGGNKSMSIPDSSPISHKSSNETLKSNTQHSEHQYTSVRHNGVSKIIVQVISVFLTLIGIGGLLFLISDFLNRTQNFGSGMIIPLIIVCTVIIFGAMGIFKPSQITEIFIKLLGVSTQNNVTDLKNEEDKNSKPSE